MRLVLFDFDGTLTNFDSFVGFLKFYAPKKKLNTLKRKYAVKILFYKLGIYSGEKLKEAMVYDLLVNHQEDHINQKGAEFVEKIIAQNLKQSTYHQFKSSIENKDHICIVSASLDVWIAPFANQHNVDYLCTELEYKSGISTGKFATPNCNFSEKKSRILQRYNLDEYDEVIAYGDSKGDEAMFELADNFYKIR